MYALALCPAGAADLRLGRRRSTRGIDWLADNSARAVEAVARLDDWIDRVFVDATVNLVARWTYALGLRLRTVQTGNIRQYVMWIAVGTVGLFVLMSCWN